MMKSRIGSLASDTMIYGIFTIMGRFITFMLTPLYTNYLTKQEVGDVTYIFSLIAFMNIVYSFGMDSSFFRFYKTDSTVDSVKVFSQSYISILTLGGIFTFILLIFSGNIAPVITELPDAKLIIIISALIPFFDAMMTIPYAMLRMTRKAKRFSVTRFALIIISVGLNVVFVVFLRWGIVGVMFAQLLATISGVIIFLPEIIKNVRFKIDRKLFADMMKFGLPTVPAMLSGMVLQVADRPILKILASSSEVAMYTVNYRLGIPMMLLVAIFEYAWKPFYLSRYNDSDAKLLFSRILTYFTFACSLFFLLTVFYMPFLVQMPFIGGKFINPDYWSGMGIIPIVLFAYYFNGMFNNFAAGFHIEKQTKYLPLAVGLAAVSNIIMNIISIPVWGIWGAALSTLFAYFISALVLYMYSRKIYRISYQWWRLSKLLLITTLFFIVGANLPDSFSQLLKFFSLTVLLIIHILCCGFFVFDINERNRLLRLLKVRS